MTSPAGAAMRLLLVDNRDSFTHILAEQLRRCGATVTVRDHQAALTRAEVETFDAAVLSPGPGRPQRAADVGTCPVVLEADIPVLGVCLGHQLMAHTLGARVDELAPVHGRTAEVTHDATGLFDGLLSPLRCVRYHSLAVLEPVPEALGVTARAGEGTVMACDFPGRPWWGVQFHPESLDAAGGLRLLGNFLRLAAAWNAAHRPRVRTAAEDAALRADLAASPKDRAENLMIADLVRNDLARTAEPGSVRVPVAFDVETYATVHQLVTAVESTPRADVTAIEVLRAAFPGGSMTGAPKARTLEILDRLEDSARGVYSGAVGHIGVDGTARFAMPIRTLVAHGTDLHYGVGGAVLALSDPDAEYEELKAKSAALAPIAEVIFPQ